MDGKSIWKTYALKMPASPQLLLELQQLSGAVWIPSGTVNMFFFKIRLQGLQVFPDKPPRSSMLWEDPTEVTRETGGGTEQGRRGQRAAVGGVPVSRKGSGSFFLFNALSVPSVPPLASPFCIPLLRWFLWLPDLSCQVVRNARKIPELREPQTGRKSNNINK